MTSLWTTNPHVLLQWPLDIIVSTTKSDVANLNAAARSVIILSIAALAMGGFRHAAAIALTAAVLLYMLSRTSQAKITAQNYFLDTQAASEMQYCQMPSISNPMANPTYADAGSGFKLPACPPGTMKSAIREAVNGQEITSQIVRSAAEGKIDPNSLPSDRAFYSMPVTTIPSNREAFVTSLYGENISRSV